MEAILEALVRRSDSSEGEGRGELDGGGGVSLRLGRLTA